MPSRAINPFETQLSATPPARHRFDSPVSARSVRASFSTISSVTCWIDAATSMVRASTGSSGSRGGPPNSASKRSFVILRPVA